MIKISDLEVNAMLAIINPTSPAEVDMRIRIADIQIKQVRHLDDIHLLTLEYLGEGGKGAPTSNTTVEFNPTIFRRWEIVNRPAEFKPELYGGFLIKSKRDLPREGYLIKGKMVKVGYVVVDFKNPIINVMPGATWFVSVDQAKTAIDVLLEYGPDRFWYGMDCVSGWFVS